MKITFLKLQHICLLVIAVASFNEIFSMERFHNLPNKNYQSYKECSVTGIPDVTAEQALYNTIGPAIGGALQALKDARGNFHYVFPNVDPAKRALHFSVALIVIPDINEDKRQAVNSFYDIVDKALHPSYNEKIIQFQMWVHGYDENKNEIHKFYGNSVDARNNLLNDFDNGIWKVEFVFKYGYDANKKDGGLARHSKFDIIDVINKQPDQDLWYYKYKEKSYGDDFKGHITAFTIKKQGIFGDPKYSDNHIAPPSDPQGATEYNALLKAYTILQQHWRANNKDVFENGVEIDHFQLTCRKEDNKDEVIIPQVGSRPR